MAIKMGIPPRVEIGSYEQAKPWIDLGVKHFCVGWDIRVVYNWCQQQATKMREMLGADAAGPSKKDKYI
jgi:4-hydroxy-2-oxoheptanedioate aldolase